MRDFKGLRIWQEGMLIVTEVYRIADLFPISEEYGLKSQIKRAAISIVSNIAEGCSRTSQKEFKYFLEISLGSTFEIETDFLVAEKLGLITTNQLGDIYSRLHSLQRQINGLINKVKQPNAATKF